MSLPLSAFKPIPVGDTRVTTLVNAKRQQVGTNAIDSALLLACFNATDTIRAELGFLKSGNATVGSNTIVASNENIGGLVWYVDDGGDYATPCASIEILALATQGANDSPGAIQINCTADGTNTVAEVGRFTNANGLTLGVAGTKVGKLQLTGNTSGTVTVTVGAAAGTWTMQLPAAVGTSGQQLTDAAGDGVCTWAAASLGAWKRDLGILDPHEALAAVVSAPTHRFQYNPDVMPAGQWAPKEVMHGIFAEEAPWAMHGERDGLRSGIAFSQINAFGYARAAIQALYEDILAIARALPAEVRARLPQQIPESA